MKFVKKEGAPHKYKIWCVAVRGTSKEDYREMPGSMKSLLLSALVREQGEICAYTMKRIDKDTSHVEHIKPRGRCRSEKKGIDLDYFNMVACFPRDGMPSMCRYGAQKKDDWWNPAVFISPLNRGCERKFRFALDGAIFAVGEGAAASNTIRVLALDHPTLMEDRRRAITEYIYGERGDSPLSRAKASRLRSEVCSKSGGRFAEFCIAVRDALDEYLKFLEKVTRKRTFAKGRKR